MERPPRGHGLARLSCAGGLAAAFFALSLVSAARSDEPASAPPPAVAIQVPALRRLTRIEYANSLRDLFGTEFPFVTELPADGQAAGFDNIGDALSLSPVLLDSYLKVARRASELVLGIGGAGVVAQQYPATGS